MLPELIVSALPVVHIALRDHLMVVLNLFLCS